MPQIIELRPSKELSNVNFEKYQFSLQTVPITDEINLPGEILHREPLPGQDSLLEARLFAFHNHLFQNPHDDSCWFFDKSDNLFRSTQTGIEEVYAPETPPPCKSYNSTIAFASPEISVLSYGGEALHILKKKPQRSAILTENIESGIVMDARLIEADDSIIVAMSSIIEQNGKKKSKLSILRFASRTDEGLEIWGFKGKQEMLVNGPVDYVFIESNGGFLDVLTGESAVFSGDSAKTDGDEEAGKKPSYYWSQDAQSLTVWMVVPEDANADVDVKVEATRLKITGIGKSNRLLLEGDCQFPIDPDTAIWNREPNLLKLQLMKQESGQMWTELLKDDTTGEHLPNAELADEIHSRLSHLCSDKPETQTQQTIGFNAEQLEDCDMEGDESYLQRVDLTDRSTTHLAILGTSNRVLFTHNWETQPSICIRQDHDGCVWSLVEGSEFGVEHRCTFPGFGYVEASKSNKKFCISPPKAGYVAIVEHTRHAFIYEKPEIGAKVAKQHIVDLGADSSPIVGSVATDDYLILLTTNKLYKLRVH